MFRTRAFALVLAVLAALACAVNPVTGRKELMLYSESQEIELGKQTDAEVAATYGIYDAADLQAYGDRGIGEPQAAGKEAPEPLVDLDRVEPAGVIGQVVVRPVGLAGFVDEPLPGVVFPGARPELQQAPELPGDGELESHGAASLPRLGQGRVPVKSGTCTPYTCPHSC